MLNICDPDDDPIDQPFFFTKGDDLAEYADDDSAACLMQAIFMAKRAIVALEERLYEEFVTTADLKQTVSRLEEEKKDIAKEKMILEAENQRKSKDLRDKRALLMSIYERFPEVGLAEADLRRRFED